MKKTVLSFIVMALLSCGGFNVAAADAADSNYWDKRIASIKESGLSADEKAFKIKLIRKYMGNDSRVKMLSSLASL